jgi:tetratricopeptide (TPR) repeat protein
VILIEDLHWADDSSAASIEALALDAPNHRWLILVTARTSGLPGWLERLRPDTVALHGLARDAAATLLDHLLGTAAELAPLKLRILAHTGNLPLFIEEVCRRLLEAGAFVGEWGAFRLGPGPVGLDVPPTVHGVIASRIDRLAPAEKLLLQTAAVIGPSGSLSLLRNVANRGPTQIASLLPALEAAALLTRCDGVQSGNYAFPHELVRQVAYDTMLGPARVSLHRRVLGELEAGGGSKLVDVSGALVHHAVMSREWSRAVELATNVAKRCIAQYALGDASRYFETAIDAVDRLEASRERELRAIDLRIEARVALGSSGKVERWLTLAKEAEARAAALGDHARAMAAMVSRASALNFAGPGSEALIVGREAVHCAEQLGDEGWLASAEYVHGHAAYKSGNYFLAAQLLAQAQDRLAQPGVRPPSGAPATYLPLVCAMMQAICHFALGDAEAIAEQQRFVSQLTKASKLPLDGVVVGITRGLLLLLRDEFLEAERSFEAALRVARDNDLTGFIPLAAFHLGLARLGQQHWEAAREALEDAKVEAASSGPLSSNLRSVIYLALADGLNDTPESGLQALRSAHAVAEQQGYAMIAVEALMVEGAALLRSRAHDTDTAVSLLSAALETASALGARPFMEWAIGSLCRAGAWLEPLGKARGGIPPRSDEVGESSQRARNY